MTHDLPDLNGNQLPSSRMGILEQNGITNARHKQYQSSLDALPDLHGSQATMNNLTGHSQF